MYQTHIYLITIFSSYISKYNYVTKSVINGHNYPKDNAGSIHLNPSFVSRRQISSLTHILLHSMNCCNLLEGDLTCIGTGITDEIQNDIHKAQCCPLPLLCTICFQHHVFNPLKHTQTVFRGVSSDRLPVAHFVAGIKITSKELFGSDTLTNAALRPNQVEPYKVSITQ